VPFRLLHSVATQLVLIWVAVARAQPAIDYAPSQSVSGQVLVTPECARLNEFAVSHAVNGQFAEAQRLLSEATASQAGRGRNSCAGFVINNIAALLSVSGRAAEAERFAARSVKILEAIYPPDDLVLLRPLSTLAAARLDQGQIARAREAFKRMQSIRIERPADRAILHGTAAVLLLMQRRLPEAEAEYLVTLHASAEAGHGGMAETAVILNSLGSLYIDERRFGEARDVLDRALTIFSSAKDAVPIDRIKLLHVRGVLLTRQGAWLEAERDFSDALAIADREPWTDPALLRALLSGYIHVLRKNHHQREARSVEARLRGTPKDHATSVVDVGSLLAQPKPPKK
jgi:tetratricopeptide (TPR) repeat protein